MAPISTPPLSSRTPRSSPTWLRSITTLGRLMRSFSQSKLSCPPASTQASATMLRQQGHRVVSQRPAGKARRPALRHEYTAMFVLLICRTGLNVSRQGLGCIGLPASSDARITSSSHRRAAEDLVSQRVGDCVQNRATAAAHGRFANPARPYGTFGIGNIQRRPLHVDRRIQNRRRPVLVETFGQGHAQVLVVDPLLAESAWPMPSMERPRIWPPSALGWMTVPTSATARKSRICSRRSPHRPRPRRTRPRRRSSGRPAHSCRAPPPISPWPARFFAEATVILLMSVGSSWPS